MTVENGKASAQVGPLVRQAPRHSLIDDVRIYSRVVQPQNSSDVTNLDNGLTASDAVSPLH